MNLFLFILIMGIFLLTVYQDMKFRTIHWLIIPLLFILGSVYRYPFEWTDILYNTVFIGVLLFSMVLYVSLKNRQFINVTKNYFGWGDILFLFAITPYFELREFMLVVIVGTVFTLILSLLFTALKKPLKTIPFAGFFSLFLMLYMVVNYIDNTFNLGTLYRG
jgi:hypothetical protein